MVPDVVFPDVELILTAYTRAALAARPESFAGGVFVSNRVPTTRRPRMVVFRRDGGPRLDAAREAARVGVNVWGGTEQDANNLARLVRALLWQAPDGNPIVRVNDLGGPVWVSDESDQPNRYFSVEVTVRGVPLPANLEA